MTRYYTGSPPFRWLRTKVFRINKPVALGLGEWEKWDAELKKTRPIAFFFTETLPEWLEWIPDHTIEHLSNVRIWLSNYFGNTHGLQSTLKKGKWHEFQERMLYSLFDSYIDFVEIEEASHHIAWNDKDESAKYNVKWWHRYWFARIGRAQRYPQAGIDHLLWEMTLDTPPDPPDPNWQASPHQAVSAREKMALYTWWKVIRPARGEAWEVSGLQAFWTRMDDKYGVNQWMSFTRKQSLTVAEQAEYDRLSKENDELEEAWEAEDEQMLIRLIKIRRSLWT